MTKPIFLVADRQLALPVQDRTRCYPPATELSSSKFIDVAQITPSQSEIYFLFTHVVDEKRANTTGVK